MADRESASSIDSKPGRIAQPSASAVVEIALQSYAATRSRIACGAKSESLGAVFTVVEVVMGFLRSAGEDLDIPGAVPPGRRDGRERPPFGGSRSAAPPGSDDRSWCLGPHRRWGWDC